MAFREIVTARLRLRRLRRADAPALIAYRSRPDVSRFQGWDVFGQPEADELIGAMQSCEPGTPGEWFQFAVTPLETDRLIGDVGLLGPDTASGRSWLGFTLDPDYSRQGFMTEAVGGVIAYAREVLGIDSVWASCDPRNIRSVALMERTGFLKIQEKVRACEFKGEWVDDWIYRRGPR